MDKSKLIYAQFDDNPREVSMLLYGEIGAYFGENMINANAFASELFMLSEAGYKVTVRINSEGGDVLRGLSIVDAVIQTGADTVAVGMAASMAGVILQAGKKRMMTDFASIMIHAATGGDEQLREIVTAQLGSLLTSKSNLGEERITKILSGDKDEWFAVKGVPDDRNAEKMGLVDEVLITNQDNPLNISQIEEKPANLFSIYAKMIGNQIDNTKVEMSNTILKAHLDVSENASDKEMIAKIDEKVENAVSLKQAEIDALKSENEALKASRAEGLIADAKEAGYPEDKIEDLKAFASNNYEAAKGTIEALKTAKAAITPIAPITNSATTPKVENGLKQFEEYTEEEWLALSDEDQNKVLNIK